MKRINKNEKGFGALELILIILVIALVGAGGLLVYKNHHKTTTADTTTGSSNKPTTSTKTPTTTKTTQVNPTAGWATYTSTLGGFSFKYPATGWSIDGFQGETPVGPGYSTGTMNGSETQVRLTETGSTGTFSTYWIVVNIGTASQVESESDSYSQGTVSTLSNGVQVWLTSASAASNPQCFSGSPIDLDLVSNHNFYDALSNGQYMSYFASFCYGQKDTTSLNYQQQVNAPEVTVAKEVLASFVFK